jgi:hypothetical protein
MAKEAPSITVQLLELTQSILPLEHVANLNGTTYLGHNSVARVNHTLARPNFSSFFGRLEKIDVHEWLYV